jgi:proline dehydrogenase
MLRALKRSTLSPMLQWALRRAARAYVAGDRIDDAVRVVNRLVAEGLVATVGFWNEEHDPPRRVADHYLDCIRHCRAGDYVSIKLPAIDFSRTLFDELAAASTPAGIRLHCDGMQPDTVERTWRLLDAVLAAGQVSVGVTLPGRWSRSIADAEWAIERQLPVRVVKGQWPDPDAPNEDLRAGFLPVVRALAGRAAHVGVASHDLAVTRPALKQLVASATRCELELLYGMPRRSSLAMARLLAVPVRIYVGYGVSFVPYAAGRLLDDPRRILWLLRDAAGLGLR